MTLVYQYKGRSQSAARGIRGQQHRRRPAGSVDWTFGPVTGHRTLTFVCMGLGIWFLYELQDFFWPTMRAAQTALEKLWAWGAILWLGAVLPGACGLIGMVCYRHPDFRGAATAIPYFVCWRIVSRGTNVEALSDTIRACQAEMRACPLFPYVIEVVTDHQPIDLPEPTADIKYLRVPAEYKTPRNSLYKARALHFATVSSDIPDDAWIVHLDEETHPTTSGIRGIARMISEEEQSKRYRIGQGAILYDRMWKEHPFLTLADMVRTGDDFARFHFGHRLGITIFGLHGSYIVVRNDLEKSIGFDVGPEGSITEDAFWALIAMERGHRCRWVDGYLQEQSTQSASDFVKQRRRWFQGLAKVALFAPVALKWRLSIGINSLLWALSPFAALYTVAHLFYGFETSPYIRFAANFSFASFGTLYFMGLKANMDAHGIKGAFLRLRWYVLLLAYLPAFTALEAAGVLTAIFRPVQGFHVVKK